MQFLSDKIKTPYPVIDGLKAVNLDLVIRDKAPVIVDFYAHWCRPCQQFTPTFRLANALVPEVTFIKVWTIPYGFYVFFSFTVIEGSFNWNLVKIISFDV